MVGGMASDMVLVLFVMRVSRMGVKTLNSIFCFFVYGGRWGKVLRTSDSTIDIFVRFGETHIVHDGYEFTC